MSQQLNASITLAAVNSAKTYAEYARALMTSEANFSADKYIAGISQANISNSMEQQGAPAFSPSQFYMQKTKPQLTFGESPSTEAKPRKRTYKPRINNPDESPLQKKKKKANEEEIATERLCRREDYKKKKMDSDRELRTTEIAIKNEPISYTDEVNNAIAAILYDPDQNLVNPQ